VVSKTSVVDAKVSLTSTTGSGSGVDTSKLAKAASISFASLFNDALLEEEEVEFGMDCALALFCVREVRVLRLGGG